MEISKTDYLTNLRFKEYKNYTMDLNSLTKFNLHSVYETPSLLKLVLTFNFKNISFEEKKIIPFVLALELLTSQKAAVTVSKKAVVSLKIRKGAFVGCKVTLRNNNLFYFLDSLNLYFMRTKGTRLLTTSLIKKSDKNSYLMQLQSLFDFFQLELNLNHNLLLLHIVWIFNTYNYQKKIFLFSSMKVPVFL